MSATPSPRSSRARNAAVVAALIAVGISARSGRAAQATPPAPSKQPAAPAAPATAATGAADTTTNAAQDSTVADSLAVQDSLAPMQTDSIQPDKFVAATPAPSAPATWPVDPVTGQTLINGRPVVGRVFIMQKVDGLVKYETVADVRNPDALAPLPPVVGQSYTPAPLTQQRRHRGIMAQATLWDIDNKRSAVRLRYYPASTPANQLNP